MKCDECGLVFAEDIQGDIELHKTYHDETLNGLRCDADPDETVVWKNKHQRIIVITPLSPYHLKVRAEKAAQIANRETKYDFPLFTAGEPIDERAVNLFIYYLNDRVIGLLIVERRTHIWRATWQDYKDGVAQDVSNIDSMWSMVYIWVIRRNRCHGVAHKLVSESIMFLGVNMDEVGWYTPFSEPGKKLVRSIRPEWFYIAR